MVLAVASEAQVEPAVSLAVPAAVLEAGGGYGEGGGGEGGGGGVGGGGGGGGGDGGGGVEVVMVMVVDVEVAAAFRALRAVRPEDILVAVVPAAMMVGSVVAALA